MKKFRDLSEENKKSLKVLLILVIVLGVGLIALYIQRTNAFVRKENIAFESGGVTLQANLLYPTKRLDFQGKRPLLIYCHGIGQSRDFDLRIPIEFTKRGYYVAALDYQGQADSQGNIGNLVNVDGTIMPSIAQDCSRLLDKLETMPFYLDVAYSQIGLIGHSLGGNVILMNQALDPRFKATVAWAPLVNWSLESWGYESLNETGRDIYNSYIPVNLCNETNSENLLVICSDKDEILNWEDNFKAIQDLTNCTLITITDPLLLGNHQLYDNRVYTWSINYFEDLWFGSTTVNGPISITFWNNYFLLVLNIGLIVALVLYFTIHTSKYFGIKKPLKDDHEIAKKEIDTTKKKVWQLAQALIPVAIVIIVWDIFENIFGLWTFLFSAITLLGAYAIYRVIRYFIKKDRKEFNFKEMLKYQFDWRPIVYSITCGVLFFALWSLFTFFYPFVFVIPSRFAYFIVGIIVAFPFYLSIEIMFRKIIFPALAYTKSRTIITIVLGLIVMISFMALTRALAWFPSFLFTKIIMIIVLLMNTFIYRNTRRFSSVMISSFLIISIFLGASIAGWFGVGVALPFMTGGYIPVDNIFIQILNWIGF